MGHLLEMVSCWWGGGDRDADEMVTFLGFLSSAKEGVDSRCSVEVSYILCLQEFPDQMVVNFREAKVRPRELLLLPKERLNCSLTFTYSGRISVAWPNYRGCLHVGHAEQWEADLTTTLDAFEGDVLGLNPDLNSGNILGM
jgi:hypothetical protein